MIKLDHDRLSFTFPEIAQQVRSHLERHIQNLLPKFLLPEERVELLNELESRWGFRQLSPARQDVLRARARSLTATEIEAALREAALSKAGLRGDSLAELTIEFQRTLRIPDDGKRYPLPAGLGRFPLRSMDDFSETAPALWLKRGGALMPMYQSEALWIRFSSRYPFAVKVAAGKINAVSGEPWSSDLQREPQDYIVAPRQPWLDGFAVGAGVIRQFVAMPLGAGYSVEEQLTRKAEVGGIQLQAYPLRAGSYYREEVSHSLPSSLRDLLPWLFDEEVVTSARSQVRFSRCGPALTLCESASMGLGAGGTMRQEIYQDSHPFADWDQTKTGRCFCTPLSLVGFC
jgi:hypothetical protein